MFEPTIPRGPGLQKVGSGGLRCPRVQGVQELACAWCHIWIWLSDTGT